MEYLRQIQAAVCIAAMMLPGATAQYEIPQYFNKLYGSTLLVISNLTVQRTRCASYNVHPLCKRFVLRFGWAPNEELIPQLWVGQELGKGAHEVICLLGQVFCWLQNDSSGPA